MSFPGGGGAGFFGGGGGDVGFAGIRIGAITQGLKQQVRGAVNDVNSELSKVEEGARKANKSWERAFGFLKVAAVGTGVAVAGVLAASASAAISFETAFAGIRKTVDFGNVSVAEAEKRYKGLSDEIRGLAKTIPIGVEELAAIGEQAGALGVHADDIKEFVRVSALIGVTTDVSADQAATALGQLSNVLGLTNKDYERFASALVDLGNKGASTESQILEIASRAGGSAKLVGIAADETLGWASAVADLGIEVEAGGSSLQNFFLKAQKAMGVKKDLLLMGKVAGMTGAQFKKAFEKDASGALTTFIQGLSKLTAGQQLDVLGALGLDDIRMSRVLLGLAGKTDGLTNSLKNAGAAWKANTALQTEASKRFATTASQIQLLQNVVKDLFISIGQNLLPGINALVKGLAENLPKAAAHIGRIWDSVLGPAVARVAAAFGKFWAAIGKVFGSDDKAANFTEVLAGGFDAVVSVMAKVLDLTTGVFDILSSLLANEQIRALAKWVSYFVALRVALSGASFFADKLNGASRGLLRGGLSMLTGGRIGGERATSGDPALNASAAKLDKSAAHLDEAAGSLAKSGAAGAGGAAGATPAGGRPTGTPGAYVDAKGAIRGPEAAVQKEISLRAQMKASADAARRAGQSMVRNTAEDLAAGIRSAARTGITKTKSAATKVLGGVAGLFWPAMVAVVGAELIKAPVGDFVASNTQFKRAGAAIKEDFFGGLIDLVESARVGSDLFTALPELNVGGKKFDTKNLNGFDVTDAQLQALQAGGVAGALAQREIAPEVRRKLGLQAGQSVQVWAENIRAQLAKQGLSTADIDAALAHLHEPNIGRFWDPNINIELDKGLKALVTSRLGELTKGLDAGATAGLATAVKEALASIGVDTSTGFLLNLPKEAYTKLAQLLVDAADPANGWDQRILGLEVIRLLKKPKVTPKLPVDNPALTPRQNEGVRSIETVAGIKGEQRTLDLEVGKQFDTAEKEAARQAGIQWFVYFEKGIKKAGKDPEARQAFLDSVNAMLAESGQPPITWDQLVDWKAELGDETFIDAQRAINAKMKSAVVEAARTGQPGAAAEFWRMWGREITAADTAKEKEALRKKINDAIPGRANDMDKTEFAAWLKSVMGSVVQTPHGTEVHDWMTGELPTKADDAETTRVRGWLGSAISGGAHLTGKQKDDLQAYGAEAVRQVAIGIRNEKNRIKIALSVALTGVKGVVPGSPVKEGPLKHPFLYKAGGLIVKQIGEGMARQSLSLPPLGMPDGDSLVGAMAGGGPYGSNQTLNVDKLQLFRAEDEKSVLQRTRFLMQPTGRGVA